MDAPKPEIYNLDLIVCGWGGGGDRQEGMWRRRMVCGVRKYLRTLISAYLTDSWINKFVFNFSFGCIPFSYAVYIDLKKFVTERFTY